MKPLIRILSIFFLFMASLWGSQQSVNLYTGQGVYNFLDRISVDATHGDLQTAPTYIYTLSYAKQSMDVSEHFKMGYEIVTAKHFGLQENAEICAAWRFILEGIIPDNPYLEMDITYGEGLSYAIGTPSFEDGPANDPQKRYNFQSYLIFDFDLYIPRYSQYHLFYRVHHRSGVYGLITPELVGSNFIGFGLKIGW